MSQAMKMLSRLQGGRDTVCWRPGEPFCRVCKIKRLEGVEAGAGASPRGQRSQQGVTPRCVSKIKGRGLWIVLLIVAKVFKSSY